MALSAAEKQQIDAAIDTFVSSPNVQAALTAFNTGAETQVVAFADKVIANATVGGLVGSVFNALKGSAEAEINTLAASLPPAALTALETTAFEGELKTLLGA